MATALMTYEASTSSCLDETAEVRMWDSEGAFGNLRDIPPDYEVPAMHESLEGRVEQLVTSECEDSEQLMHELQEELRCGNRRIAQMLASAFHQRRFDADARGLALETLAAARVRSFEPQVVELVRTAIESPEPELQFAGIAAASDLSRTKQVAISRVVRSLISAPTASTLVKQAGEAFLKRVNSSTLGSRG
jgi:hypothetical protein